MRETFFNNSLVQATDAPQTVSLRRHTMLNRNEYFAEIQVDAFAVIWITELAPLDHEESYSVNRRQSQNAALHAFAPRLELKQCVSAVNAARISPVKFHAKCLRHRARCTTLRGYSCVLRHSTFLLTPSG